MNNFFYRLQIFFSRLHFMLSIVLVAWELIGQSYSFGTPLLGLSSAFEINMNQAFGLIAGVIIASAIFWSYLIGSFVDKDQMLSDSRNDLIAAAEWVCPRPEGRRREEGE